MEGFKHWLFSEMPANIRHLGNWEKQPTLPIPGLDQEDKKKATNFKRYGWHWDDFSILTSKGGIEKLNRKWLKVPQQVEMYLLRNKTAYKQQEIGAVSETQLKLTLGLNVVGSPQEMKGPMDIYINPDAINIIYTNNLGADRMPFTYWTAAHRLGHAIKGDYGYNEFIKLLETEIASIIKEVYGKTMTRQYRVFDRDSDQIVTEFIKQIGTMKSARDGTVRNIYEFGYELLAQYMLSGKIKFNKIPTSFGKRGTFGRRGTYTGMPAYGTRGGPGEAEVEDYNEMLWSLARGLEYYAEQALDNVVGKIFVM